MKALFAPTVFFIVSILFGTSCIKDPPATPLSRRTVQYVLYTDKDFSSDNNLITFRLSIQNSADQTLWDSIMAPIAIKEIPDSAHRIVVEKLVPTNDLSAMKVGFYYEIENVGNSWYLDSFPAGMTFKKVEFNFK